jgi:hypothetical protein
VVRARGDLDDASDTVSRQLITERIDHLRRHSLIGLRERK